MGDKLMNCAKRRPIATKLVIKEEEAVRAMLASIGEDPDREGLLDTPKRVIKSWDKLYGGYKQRPEDILKTKFSCEYYDEMILLRNIPLYSMCEHHILPFTGKCHIGYIPGKCGKVVGISKLARLMEMYARRAQIQEKLTMQIGESLVKYIQPKGVAVIIEATHMCMTARGVEKAGSSMVTSFMSGVFKTKQATRSELLSLIKL
jgi:GTP cyclohydrolase I